MGIFERYLSVWVGLAMTVGVGLGLVVPDFFHVVAGFEWAKVNLLVALLIWLMIFPMMLKVEPSCLKEVGKKPKGLVLTLIVRFGAARGCATVHSGHDFTGRGPLYCHGVCMEPPYSW